MKQIRKLVLCLLLLSLLSGCAGGAPVPAPQDSAAPTAEPTPVQAASDGVRVSDISSFLAALAPGAVIELDCAMLQLDRAGDYGFSYDSVYSWQNVGYRQYGLVIRDVDDLTIRSVAEGGTVINTDALFADVLRFEGCDDLTLEGLTLGHRGEDGGCLGSVISLNDCARTTLRRCELFGCGAIGLNAYGCDKLRLEDCVIRDCQLSALTVTCCTDFQARDCEIARCGRDSGLGTLCVASCEGFALINSSVRDGANTCLLDMLNSTSVCLMGCEASGNRFSNALFCLYDDNVTVSGCSLGSNAFGSCYQGGAYTAVTGAGSPLMTFQDFLSMERKPFVGDYVGPEPGPVPTPAPFALPSWDGDFEEIHVQTVDELLSALAPHTVIYLDAEEFDLSTASDYGGEGGTYYRWVETYDGPELELRDLEDVALIGQGRGVTLFSAVPRYANVLSLSNCRDISLADMTMGHYIEPGFCTGDVLEIYWCENVSVSGCGLFGCGEIGIRAICSSSLRFLDTNIYDCSYLGADLDRVQDAQFVNCPITDCGGDYGFNGIHLSECSGIFYDAELIRNGDFFPNAKG